VSVRWWNPYFLRLAIPILLRKWWLKVQVFFIYLVLDLLRVIRRNPSGGEP
jgi:hypothetical protein